MTSPDTLPGSGPEPFADNLGNHPEPFCQQVGMASAKHGLRQIRATRPAQGNGTAPTVHIDRLTGEVAVGYEGGQKIRRNGKSRAPAFWRINAEQSNPDLAERDGVSVHDTWVVADRLYRETNAFRGDWRMGEYDDDQHEQRREHADDDRPNLLRRWIDRALGMGTLGEWAADGGGVLILMALFVCMFVFAAIFGS